MKFAEALILWTGLERWIDRLFLVLTFGLLMMPPFLASIEKEVRSET